MQMSVMFRAFQTARFTMIISKAQAIIPVFNLHFNYDLEVI